MSAAAAASHGHCSGLLLNSHRSCVIVAHNPNSRKGLTITSTLERWKRLGKAYMQAFLCIPHAWHNLFPPCTRRPSCISRRFNWRKSTTHWAMPELEKLLATSRQRNAVDASVSFSQVWLLVHSWHVNIDWSAVDVLFDLTLNAPGFRHTSPQCVQHCAQVIQCAQSIVVLNLWRCRYGLISNHPCNTTVND